MNAFNRAFIALLALGWVAALGAAIWLIWDQSRLIDITSSSINLNFDIIADTRAEQILATIVAAALMLPALMLLLFEMKPSRKRESMAYSTNDADSRRASSRDMRDDDFAEERSRIDDARPRDVSTREAQPSGSRRWGVFPRR